MWYFFYSILIECPAPNIVGDPWGAPGNAGNSSLKIMPFYFFNHYLYTADLMS